MPFTLSHPAAILLLVRSGVPVSGLVLGSMVPDVPMFGLVPYSYGFAHSLFGIVTVDLLVGTAGAVLWIVLIRDALANALPEWLRERSYWGGPSRRGWLLLPLGVTIGALTHVAWDELTHQGRWGTRHVPWLAEDHVGYAGYHWTQAISSVLGLAVVVSYAALVLRRRPPKAKPAAAQRIARWLLTAVLVITAAIGAAYAITNLDRGLHAAAIAAAVHAMGVMVLATLTAGLMWRVAASHAER